MFFKKTTLLCAMTLLALSGCVSTQSEQQQTQISNLKSELVASKAVTEQAKTELKTINETLKIKQHKVVELTESLEKSENANKALKNRKIPVESNKVMTHLDDKTILGQAEWVYVSATKKNYKGRIDTGATTSSISALDIERFERDGEKWVRFNLAHSKDDSPQIVESKIIRVAKIIQATKPGDMSERVVIKLHVRIGDVVNESEFTLTDRAHMAYPVLIGRTFMQDVVLVDVSKEYIFPQYKAQADK